MKILHCVGHSLVRYTPARIAAYWGRYTLHEGRAVALRRAAPLAARGWHFREPLNPYGYFCAASGSKWELRRLVGEADVIHCHDDAYPRHLEQRFGLDLTGKALVYHAHIGNIPERYFRRSGRLTWDPRVKHAGITNGYGHLFDEDERLSNGERRWGRLPDILDLDHPAYRPEPGLRRPIDAGPLRVVYTYSNHREGEKINAKRPHGHRRLIESPRPIPGVEFRMVGGRPFEEAMALKRSAHIVLEEVFTPYLHLSALEGAAVGAMVLTNFGSYVREELSRIVGASESEWPFFFCTNETLRDTLEMLVEKRDLVLQWGERARRWMLNYYQAPALLRRYEEFYARP